MRLAVCALSTVLLSGCSWFGMGAGNNSMYGYDNYGYGYGYSAYGQQASGNGCGMMQGQTQVVQTYGNGCAPGNAYAANPSGHGGTYGATTGTAYGHNMGAGSMHAGSMGSGYSGSSSMTYGGATTLGSSAPYGSAVGSTQYGGGNVQTVVGQPIYVAQPYPAYYNAQAPALRGYMSGGGGYGYGGGAGCCGGAALPVGVEVGVGTEFSIGGDIFPGEVSKPFLGGPGTVSDLAAVSYADAYNEGVHVDLATTYDLDQNTTVYGQIGYSKSNGQRMKVGTVDNGAGTSEDLFAEFSDLEQVRLEGGLRRYMGNGHGVFRPYVGASAGFVNTQDVELTQSSETLVDPTLFTQNYVDGGWTPTAAGIVGAEWAVGGRSAIGIETGIRWSDDLDTNFQSSDRWSIPLKLRGRVSF